MLKSQNKLMIFFITRDIFSERASSFRQQRWCKIFLDLDQPICIYNVDGFFSVSRSTFTSVDDFETICQARSIAYTGPQTSTRQGLVSRLFRPLKHFCLADLYLPHVFNLILNLCLEVHSLPNKVVIFASSPPFSLALAAALIKRIYSHKVAFVLDMRDAWASHPSLGGWKLLKKNIERQVVSQCDYLLTVSRYLAEDFSQTYQVNSQVIYNAPTQCFKQPLVDQFLHWESLDPALRSDTLKIVYSGSIPPSHYNLELLVTGIRDFLLSDSSFAFRIQFVFIGNCEIFCKHLSKYGILKPGLFFFPGHVPHSDILSIQKSADVLLFLGHKGHLNSGVVSTKLFEYFYSSTPILPVDVCLGSDVDILLRRYCDNVSPCVNSTSALSNALINIANGNSSQLPSMHSPEALTDLLHPYLVFSSKLLTFLRRS